MAEIFSEPVAEGPSVRQLAAQREVARSPVGYGKARQAVLPTDPEWVQFFESSAGSPFPQRLVIALHLIFGVDVNCGVRKIGRFLERVGLDRLVVRS